MKTLSTHDIAPARIDKAIDLVTAAANAGNPYTETAKAAALAEEIGRLRKLLFTCEAARIAAVAKAAQPELSFR